MGAIPDEKYRLLVDGLPPWYSVGIFNYMEQLGGVGALTIYPMMSWHLRLDPKKSVESFVRKYAGCIMNFPHLAKAETVVQLAREYRVDTNVLFDSPACKGTGGESYAFKLLLDEVLKLPTLLLQGDLCDPRDYSDVEMKAKIDAFFEALGG